MTATGRTVVWLTLGVGLVRFGTEVINSISHGPYFNWQGAFSQAYLAIMIQWAATFCGGALYAFLAGHRGRPTLGDCSLGGASVGFGGALLGEVLSGLFLVAVASYRSVDLFLGSLIGCSVLVNYFLYPFLGVLVGGAGGGAVGLLTAGWSGPDRAE